LDFIISLTNYTFLQNAVMAAFFASIACGITGTFVVKKKMTFVSGGIAHSILGGIGIAYFFNVNITLGAVVFALLFSAVITLVKINARQQEDTVIGVLWAVGMSIGIIFMYMSPGYNVDLLSFIFGNILMVSSQDIIIVVILDIIIILTVFLFYYHFMYVSFDEEYLKVKGVNVNFIYFLMLTLISLTVIILIKIVGLILVIALLTLPSVIASQFTNKLSKIMIISVILGVLFTFFGICLSFYLNIPAGPCIIIISGIIYAVVLLLKHIPKK